MVRTQKTKAEFSAGTRHLEHRQKVKETKKVVQLIRWLQKGVVVCEVMQVQPCRMSSVVERGAATERCVEGRCARRLIQRGVEDEGVRRWLRTNIDGDGGFR